MPFYSAMFKLIVVAESNKDVFFHYCGVVVPTQLATGRALHILARQENDKGDTKLS